MFTVLPLLVTGEKMSYFITLWHIMVYILKQRLSFDDLFLTSLATNMQDYFSNEIWRLFYVS